MTVYLDLCEYLAGRVARGELPPGAELPSVRELARERGAAPATVARVYAELGRAGVIRTRPRVRARVARAGQVAARRLLEGGETLRLAGSDDPALDLVLAAAHGGVDRVGARGSFGGLTALWQREAEAAVIHLRHVSGVYNAPFASRVLSGRDPLLVRLWRREQCLVVPPGNPGGLRSVDDLVNATVALRSPGTGTRALLDRLLRQRRFDPRTVRGPELGSHLDVALAVASGLADCGVAVRSAATICGLDAVPLAWEPFDLALPEAALGGVEPLLAALGEVSGRIEALAGYDLEGTGRVSRVA